MIEPSFLNPENIQGQKRYFEETFWLPIPSWTTVFIVVALLVFFAKAMKHHEVPDLKNLSIDGVSTMATYGDLKYSLSENDYTISKGRGYVSYSARRADVNPEYILFEAGSEGDVPPEAHIKSISGRSLKGSNLFIGEGDPTDPVWEKFPTAKAYEDSASHGILVLADDSSLLIYYGEGYSVSRIGWETSLGSP